MSENADPKVPTRRKPGPGRGRGRGRGRGGPNQGNTGNGMTPQQLRQRRARILHDKFHQEKEEKQWTDIAEQGGKRREYYMTKLYMVVITAFVVTLLAGLHYMRKPAFLYRKKAAAPPPMYLGTLYPRNVIMERDLPRFFQSYSIATPNNQDARKAVIKVANSRQALKRRTGNLKVILKAWDSSNVDLLLERNICGQQFERAYRSSKTSEQRQDDLLMWCLLATRLAEGFFLESVDMINNAFMLTKKRGMIIQKSSGSDRISNAYYLHPRLPGEDLESHLAPYPAMILSWLLEHPEDSLEDPSVALQHALYDLAFSAEHRDRYLVLNEVCQETQPLRAIGKQCTSSSEESSQKCCYFVVPETEGGRIDEEEDEEHEIAARQRSLREGLQNEGNADAGSIS